MTIQSTETTFRGLDGLHLAGTLVLPDLPVERAVVLVHGGGVTRDEGGFFTRLAVALAESGVGSLRFDLRGHGASDGSQADRTLSAHLNDIRSAFEHTRSLWGAPALSLIGTSFGGGLAAYYAARGPDDLSRLVLLNPQLNYKDRYIDQKPHWHNDQLADEEAERLRKLGYLEHSPTVKHGRAFLNEVFWIRPNDALGDIVAPTLIVHGTKDTFVPVELSRWAARQLRVEHELVEIEGAQHGFAVHEDPEYLDPQSQRWQAFVINKVVEWLTAT
ncbi:alpha/beta hydrolase [Allokutzneria sp. NRRL B-24872]|uniref:alpha/beta hydrolase n=1 Tax=Allokutzneria sp. NRRL B-24872 TaxID=1137961 RepID=UPI000A3BA186|nr:alpha/beta fold hydrolase [Allokutzneria sp. NRRL B-24872]